MNPRIYKKQAKRAVELLRSHGGWNPSCPLDNPYPVGRYEHPNGHYSKGIGIDGCPVFGWMSSTMDGQEWDERCPRDEWIELHYWTFVVPDDYFKSGDEAPPPMTVQQRRERFSTRQLAPGWRWRGGHAVKVAACAS